MLPMQRRPARPCGGALVVPRGNRPPRACGGGLGGSKAKDAPTPMQTAPRRSPTHRGPPPQRCGGLLRFGTTEVAATTAQAPPWHLEHRGPRRVGTGAPFALRLPRPLPRGLLRFRSTETPSALAWGPPSHWEHCGPRRVGMGASFALGPTPPPAWARRDRSAGVASAFLTL